MAVLAGIFFAATDHPRAMWCSISGAGVAFFVAPVLSLAELGLLVRDDRPRGGSRKNIGEKPRRDMRPFPLSTSQYEFFAQAVVAPKEAIGRIREKVEVRSRAVVVETRFFLESPTDPGALYVPVLILKKGHLVDDLEVESGDGADLPILPYSRYVHLATTVVDRLARNCGASSFKAYKKELRAEVVAVIGSRAPASPKREQQIGRLLGRLDSVLGQDDAAGLVTAMVDLLVRNYCQVVAVPPACNEAAGGAMVIRVRYRQIHDLRLASWRAWFVPALLDRFRVALGVRSSTFTFPLDKAVRAASYHLEFMGPEGTYLARQTFSGVDGDGNPIEFGPQHAAYSRARRRHGQRYAHLYVREADDRVRSEHLRARFTFFERMPGSVGEASIAAVVTAVLTLAIGYLAARPHGGGTGPVDVGIVAILLAFPAAAAGAIGLSRPTGPVGGAMAARLGSVSTFVIAVIAALVALGLPLGADLPVSPHLLGMSDQWTVLATCSLVNALCLAASWLRRSIVYSRVLNRPETISPN